MSKTVEQFAKSVVAAGLSTNDEIKSLWAALPAGERPKDGEAFSNVLVQRQLLTEFQASELLAGGGTPLVLGDYVLLAKIGAGGMGQVFKARHRHMERVVAIKLLPAELTKDDEAVKRFQREVKAAAKLAHANIVQAYDASVQKGVWYLVMEFVEGRDLATVVAKEGSLPMARAVDYTRQAARGLAFAHENGVVHRDIKPANLLLDKKGVVKILDMGLARIDDAAMVKAQEGLTQSGQVMGTVDYMAPEQAFDTRTADARADIYSLGCTLHRLLTGHNLYEGETLVAKLMAHQTKPIPSLTERQPHIPATLDKIFARMVAKQPEDRFQTMAEVEVALAQLQSSASSQPSASQAVGPEQKQRGFFSSFLGAKLAPTAVQPQTAASPADGFAPTVSLVNPSVGTDPVSERSIQVARGSSVVATAERRQTKFSIWIVSGVVLAALVAFGIWGIVRDKDSNTVSGNKFPSDGAVVNSTDPYSASVSASSSPLDLLDPAQIPAAERFDWQPKELVAVVGTHGRTHWQFIVAAAISPDGKLAATLAPYRNYPDNLLIWDMAAQSIRWRLRFETGHGGKLWFTPDSRKLVAFTRDSNHFGAIFDLSGPEPVAAALNDQGARVWAMSSEFFEDGSTLVCKLHESLEIALFHADWSVPQVTRLPTPTLKIDKLSGTPWFYAPLANQLLYRSPKGWRRVGVKNREWVNDEELAIPLAVGEDIASISPDGKRAIVRASDLTHTIWDVTATPPIKTPLTFQGLTLSGFSPDQRWIHTMYTDIRLFRITDSSVAMTTVLERNNNSSNSRVVWSRDGQRALAMNDIGPVRFWDVAGDQPREINPLPAELQFRACYGEPLLWSPTTGLLFLPHGYLVSSRAKSVAAWNLAGQAPHPYPPSAPLLDPQSSGRLLVAGPDTVLNASSGERWKIMESGWQSVGSNLPAANRTGDATADGRWFVELDPSAPQELVGWDLTADPPVRRWSVTFEQRAPHSTTGLARHLALSPDGAAVVAIVPTKGDASKSELLLFKRSGDSADLYAQLPVTRSDPNLTRFALAPAGRYLASSRAASGEVKLEDLTTLQPKPAGSHASKTFGAVEGLAFSPDGRHLACAMHRGVQVLEVPSLRVLWEWQSPGLCYWIDWAADNRHLVWLNSNNTVYAVRLNQLVPASSRLSQPGTSANALPKAVAPFDARQARAHQEAWAKHLGTKVETPNRISAKMVLIPPGEFLMGSSDEQIAAAVKIPDNKNADSKKSGGLRAEQPQRSVTITKPFLIGQTEVTVEQFKRFHATGYVTIGEKARATDKTVPTFQESGSTLAAVTEDSPAVVAWDDAVAFCEWLTKENKQTYRLPTEAEWEYACRAGTTTAFSFGDDESLLPQYGWFLQNSQGKLQPVAKKLPNPFGLFDMHGNAREWCQDQFDEQWYSRRPNIDPVNSATGNSPIMRGGFWNRSPYFARSACRENYPFAPTQNRNYSGFRVVAEVNSPTADKK